MNKQKELAETLLKIRRGDMYAADAEAQQALLDAAHLLSHNLPESDTRIIHVNDLEMTCGGAPTIYDFVDQHGEPHYFRLRHGGARLVNEKTKETILSGEWLGSDGVCNWDDVKAWAKAQGVILI